MGLIVQNRRWKNGGDPRPRKKKGLLWIILQALAIGLLIGLFFKSLLVLFIVSTM